MRREKDYPHFKLKKKNPNEKTKKNQKDSSCKQVYSVIVNSVGPLNKKKRPTVEDWVPTSNSWFIYSCLTCNCVQNRLDVWQIRRSRGNLPDRLRWTNESHRGPQNLCVFIPTHQPTGKRQTLFPHLSVFFHFSSLPNVPNGDLIHLPS